MHELEVVGFIPVRLVVPWVSTGSFTFICVRSHLGFLGFIRLPLVLFVSAQGVVWFIRVRNGSRWVHSCSFGSFGRAVKVVWHICIHSGVSWKSLGLLELSSALSVVGFIRVRLVHSGEPLGLVGSFRFVRALYVGR